MEKKQTSIVLAGGIIVNILLLFFILFMYWKSIPQESDLNPVEIVAKPQVYNSDLEKELNELKKVKGLPIEINPNELGKQNPYNF